ncbi:MAG: hypothetical protein ABWZ87_06295, partial [Aeromicrobium sp.]
MSERTLQGLIGLVLAGLLAVVAAGAVLGSDTVASDLRDRAVTALAAAGLDDVLVDFRGREAELSGGNDVEIRRAEALVAALPGVRRVDVDVVDDADIRGVARFELDRAGDDVEISGVVPTPDDAAAIKVGVAGSLRTTITGDVAVDRSVAAASWVRALPEVLEVVAGIEGLELEIPGDGTVAIGGTVGDE